MPGQPGNHPRIFFDSDELNNLKQQATSGLRAQCLARLKHVAERLIDPNSNVYLDYKEREREIWETRYGIFTYIPSIETLAAAYAFTGDKRFGEAARDAVLTVIENKLADVNAMAYATPTKGWRHGLGHDKHNYARANALVFDFCYDLFSDEQKAIFVDHAKESIEIANEISLVRGDMDQVGNNRGARGLLAPFWWQMAIEGEPSVEIDIEKVCRFANYVINLYQTHCYTQDGAPVEGPGYSGTIGGVALAARAVNNRGFGDAGASNRYERFIDYLLYELVPGGGSVNNLNDTNHPNGWARLCIHTMGQPRARMLPWLAQNLELHPTRINDWLTPEDDATDKNIGAELLPYLLYWKDDEPVVTPEEAGYPLSHWFPIRGVASHRTGWLEGDSLLSHFSGHQERRLHRQGDYNHIAYYALGENFLADAGYGDIGSYQNKKDASRAVDRWYMRSDAHNCILVDGEIQRDTFNNQGWSEGELLDFQQEEGFSSSLGDASATVGIDQTIRRNLRRVVLVRQGPCEFVAVIDVVEKDGNPFEAKTIWQTLPQLNIDIGSNEFTIQGKASKCVGKVLYPDSVEITPNENYTMPQVHIARRDSIVENVTIFCPLKDGEQMPTFSVTRNGEGDFTITAERDGKTATLRATTCVHEPLRKTDPVQLSIP